MSTVSTVSIDDLPEDIQATAAGIALLVKLHRSGDEELIIDTIAELDETSTAVALYVAVTMISGLLDDLDQAAEVPAPTREDNDQ